MKFNMFSQGALQFIVPILMQTLAKQEEFDDEDDWNPCKVLINSNLADHYARIIPLVPMQVHSQVIQGGVSDRYHL